MTAWEIASRPQERVGPRLGDVGLLGVGDSWLRNRGSGVRIPPGVPHSRTPSSVPSSSRSIRDRPPAGAVLAVVAHLELVVAGRDVARVLAGVMLLVERLVLRARVEEEPSQFRGAPLREEEHDGILDIPADNSCILEKSGRDFV